MTNPEKTIDERKAEYLHWYRTVLLYKQKRGEQEPGLKPEMILLSLRMSGVILSAWTTETDSQRVVVKCPYTENLQVGRKEIEVYDEFWNSLSPEEQKYFVPLLKHGTQFVPIQGSSTPIEMVYGEFAYCPGGSLADRVTFWADESVVMREQSIVNIVDQIGQALAILHGKGITHRDVTPSNILLMSENDYRLNDLGNSNRVKGDSREVFRIGLLEYMAPEAILGEANNALSDQYSLATIIYERISNGRLPFGDDQPTLQDLNHASSEEERVYIARRRLAMKDYKPLVDRSGSQNFAFISVLKEIDPILEKALATNPNQRYANMSEFREALLAVLHSAQDSRIRQRH